MVDACRGTAAENSRELWLIIAEELWPMHGDRNTKLFAVTIAVAVDFTIDFG